MTTPILLGRANARSALFASLLVGAATVVTHAFAGDA